MNNDDYKKSSYPKKIDCTIAFTFGNTVTEVSICKWPNIPHFSTSPRQPF